VHQQPAITAEELAQIVDISSKTGKAFKRKILDVMAEKKPRKKNSSWEDLIFTEDQKQNGSVKTNSGSPSIPSQTDD
jgi:hypothetical protein